MNNRPVAGWIVLAFILAVLTIVNAGAFLVMPFSTALAFCLMVDVFAFMAVKG